MLIVFYTYTLVSNKTLSYTLLRLNVWFFKICLMFMWINANILIALGEKYWDNTNASSLHTHWWDVTALSVYYTTSVITADGHLRLWFVFFITTTTRRLPACTSRSFFFFVSTFPLPPVVCFRLFLFLKDLQLIFIGTSKNKIDNVNINHNHAHQITCRLIYAFF